MVERQPSRPSSTPKTPAASASSFSLRRRGQGALGRGCGRAGAAAGAAGAAGKGVGFSAASTTSGVKGGWRKRTPVASKMALAMAAVPGTEDDSPTPSGGCSGRGICITSITGTSRKLRMG